MLSPKEIIGTKLHEAGYALEDAQDLIQRLYKLAPADQLTDMDFKARLQSLCGELSISFNEARKTALLNPACLIETFSDKAANDTGPEIAPAKNKKTKARNNQPLNAADITIQDITQSAKETYWATGARPTAKSGVVKYGPLKDLTNWKTIQNRLRKLYLTTRNPALESLPVFLNSLNIGVNKPISSPAAP